MLKFTLKFNISQGIGNDPGSVSADTDTIFFKNNDTSCDDLSNDDDGMDSDHVLKRLIKRIHFSDAKEMFDSPQSQLYDIDCETLNMDQTISDRRIIVDSPGRQKHPYRIKTRRTTFTITKGKIRNNKRTTSQKVLMSIDRVLEPEIIDKKGANAEKDQSNEKFARKLCGTNQCRDKLQHLKHCIER